MSDQKEGAQMAPMGYSGPNDAPPSYDELFRVERPKYNDLWAGILVSATLGGPIGLLELKPLEAIDVAVLTMAMRLAITQFLLVIGAFTAISGYVLHSVGFDSLKDTLQGQSHMLSILFPIIIVIALVYSWVYFWLARLFTKQFIWITGILNIAEAVLMTGYMFAKHNWAGGAIFALFTVFSIVAFISWIPRIPFSVLMLQTTMDIGKSYGHVHTVSAIGGLIAAAWGVWFSVTLTAVYGQFGDRSSVWMGLFFFLTFASYWFSEWLKNTIHTTIAGVYGSWYFGARSYPRHVTRSALRRSLTYSFGSISFGSLLVAIIEFLQQMCSMARQQEAAQGDLVGSILFCVLGCLISILQWAAQFINRYAFSYIALYGTPYIQAAKDTWKMIKNRGIDALINECLINPVLGFGSLAVAYACSFTAYIYMQLRFSDNPALTAGATGFAFVVGLQICAIFTVPISSGFETLFVAMAWDPEVMIRDRPDLYNRMVQVYPRVQEFIHA